MRNSNKFYTRRSIYIEREAEELFDGGEVTCQRRSLGFVSFWLDTCIVSIPNKCVNETAPFRLFELYDAVRGRQRGPTVYNYSVFLEPKLFRSFFCFPFHCVFFCHLKFAESGTKSGNFLWFWSVVGLKETWWFGRSFGERSLMAVTATRLPLGWVSVIIQNILQCSSSILVNWCLVCSIESDYEYLEFHEMILFFVLFRL